MSYGKPSGPEPWYSDAYIRPCVRALWVTLLLTTVYLSRDVTLTVPGGSSLPFERSRGWKL